MIPAPIPNNEEERLEALARTRLHEGAPEIALQGLVRSLSYAVKSPIALLSVIESDRQWLMCRVGIDVEHTPRELSFCGHTIASGEPLVIKNAFADARFFDNPLVKGELGVRAYLGAPLVAKSGVALGALCAIDVEPRDWTDAEIALTVDLAAAVVGLIDARARRFELRDLAASLSTKAGFF